MTDGMEKGYVNLWRKSLESAVFKNANLWMFWCWCLTKATYKPYTTLVGYQKIDLLPGQFIFGRRKAAEELPLSEQEIRTCLKTLENLQNLTSKPTNKYTIITICNWERYQNQENEINQQVNQQLTNKQPATNHIQEDKELKEENKSIELSNDNSSTEPKETSASVEQDSPVFIKLPLNDKTEYPITDKLIASMSELYPAVDVRQEFRGMRGWLDADTTRRKTKRGIKRFYTGWLSKSQDRHHGSQNSPQQQKEDNEEKFYEDGRFMTRSEFVEYNKSKRMVGNE